MEKIPLYSDTPALLVERIKYAFWDDKLYVEGICVNEKYVAPQDAMYAIEQELFVENYEAGKIECKSALLNSKALSDGLRWLIYSEEAIWLTENLFEEEYYTEEDCISEIYLRTSSRWLMIYDIGPFTGEIRRMSINQKEKLISLLDDLSHLQAHCKKEQKQYSSMLGGRAKLLEKQILFDSMRHDISFLDATVRRTEFEIRELEEQRELELIQIKREEEVEKRKRIYNDLFNDLPF